MTKMWRGVLLFRVISRRPMERSIEIRRENQKSPGREGIDEGLYSAMSDICSDSLYYDIPIWKRLHVTALLVALAILGV
jgi:hypothetical protein